MAWQEFVLEYRPLLYRAADSLDPNGGARELADSLYAELFGIADGPDQRRSLFHYFHGRSSLATWLRAVLAQRYVDRLRAERRFEPLPDEDGSRGEGSVRVGIDSDPPDPDRRQYLILVREAFSIAIGRLSARDRLRLGCYYVEELTLAATGRLLGEHEATTSRQLARTRNAIRGDVERQLRSDGGLTDEQIAECFSYAAEDPGPLDLKRILAAAADRKDPTAERSLP
jgi:RNA polymerase sigma factor (sigma-70 family)